MFEECFDKDLLKDDELLFLFLEELEESCLRFLELERESRDNERVVLVINPFSSLENSLADSSLRLEISPVDLIIQAG